MKNECDNIVKKGLHDAIGAGKLIIRNNGMLVNPAIINVANVLDII